ncbi:hypothetical protein G9A89_021412 [Geosiphon pyriformis]|nr:hypothetical protein G9A89_021412 [Geosiphon pyriformis]
MTEEEIVGQGEIVSTSQAISISPYDQYMLAIERRVKDQAQIFEAEAIHCESGEIGLINLHIQAKSHNHIKISIYNTTKDVITIPEGTIIGYLSIELEDQPPSIISDFSQLYRYVDITSQTIYGQNECNFLPTNHNFTSIITEINKEIEHHTQQRYPITYTSKGKGKLQTPAVTPQKIQPPTWKKTRVEFPNNPSYYYTPGSAINILSTDTFTSNMTSTFGHFPFQSKQRKEDLLGPYSEYFEEFKSRLPMPSEF